MSTAYVATLLFCFFSSVLQRQQLTKTVSTSVLSCDSGTFHRIMNELSLMLMLFAIIKDIHLSTAFIIHYFLQTNACTKTSLSPVSLVKLCTILRISIPLLRRKQYDSVVFHSRQATGYNYRSVLTRSRGI